jgi:hypothetical protein
MNTYPENDYRTYLEHSSKAHKYISRKRGKGGKWIYTYASNVTGAKARQDAEIRWKNYQDAKGKLSGIGTKDNPIRGEEGLKKYESLSNIADVTGREYTEAKSKYDKTPLGKYEKAKNKAAKKLRKLKSVLKKRFN